VNFFYREVHGSNPTISPKSLRVYTLHEDTFWLGSRSVGMGIMQRHCKSYMGAFFMSTFNVRGKDLDQNRNFSMIVIANTPQQAEIFAQYYFKSSIIDVIERIDHDGVVSLQFH